MTSRLPLLQAIQQCDMWHHIDDSLGYSTVPMGEDGWNENIYSLDEFREVDPRLVELLADRIDRVKGIELKISMTYWSRTDIWIPRISLITGEDIGRHSVHSFNSFKWFDGIGDVIVSFNYYDLGRTKSGVTFAFQVLRSEEHVAPSWLDEHFPKWREHALVAQALNLDATAFTSLLLAGDSCAKKILPLPDLSFD